MGHIESSRISLDGLVRAAQAELTDDSPAMNAIVRRFRFLARRLAGAATEDRHLRDDLENAALTALTVAVRRHHPYRRGFPSFARAYMRGAVHREQQRWLPPEGVSEVPVAHDLGLQPESSEEAVLDRLAPWGGGKLAVAVANLAPEQKRLLAHRYLADAPLSLVADETGTTTSAVSQRLKTIHGRLATALAA